ncbi:unnamed protein product [Ambrosiozyma monospora]|uniref:Unnamed protein product n=1 Tax=Ambrosiozyma monospora TaxID=43982 RepID=A0ACB5T6X5_AMBMO|nr:unnamed protein product [Ambrosiozyma monospora]
MTSLISLSVGAQKYMAIYDFEGHYELKESINPNIHIDWECIRTLPPSKRDLNLSGAVIESGDSLPETIEIFQCKRDQLKFFSIESTNTVRSLTLFISGIITESDTCWDYLPNKLTCLFLEGEISMEASENPDIQRADAHPY